MRISAAAFTDRGHALGARLRRELEASGDTVRLERCGAGGVSLGEWTGDNFGGADALIFIGAAGIAVRAVAPFVASKTSDPAVVVVDDCGRFAISLLSGHIGGANELAERVAGLIGATPVITTATDAGGVFAVDTWARRNGLAIGNPERIKTVSATLLSGGTVFLESAFPLSGPLPEGFRPAAGRCDVRIDIAGQRDDGALALIPPVAVLGVGCRKGATIDAIERAFEALCAASGIAAEAFVRVCSIDLKRDEPGLVAFCARRRLPFETFDAATLAAVPGEFSASGFVASVTGVDNVCERSAMAGGGDRLIAGKTALDGVAMAVAAMKYTVSFSNGNGGGA